MVWDGTAATPVTLAGVSSSVFAAQGNRVFTIMNRGIWEINTTTNTVTEFQADSGFFRNFVIGATGQERLVVIGHNRDFTRDYLMQLNTAGDAFEPIIDFNNATAGIDGRFGQGVVFNNKLYFFAGTGSDRPVYVYDGTGVPTLVGGLAAFTSDVGATVDPLSVTSMGVYLKPTLTSFSFDPSTPIDQDYVAIRADGSVEVVDVGDMTRSSRQLFEAHGVEYIVGTYEDENFGASSGMVLKLNAGTV